MRRRHRLQAPRLGIDDLAATSGPLALPPDGQPPPAVITTTPRDLPGWYAAAGNALDGLHRLSDPRLRAPDVWSADLPQGSAIQSAQLWERLRSDHPGTGLWPLLTTEPAFDDLGESEPRADAGDGAGWLTRALFEPWGARPALADHLPRGPRPELEPSPADNATPADDDWTGAIRVLDESPTRLLLVPAENPWRIPALLGWRGARSVEIGPAVHTSVLRRWATRYAARPLGVAGRSLWLQVGAPPADFDSALHTAVEVAGYCPDAVLRTQGTVEELARALLLPVWMLRWDDRLRISSWA